MEMPAMHVTEDAGEDAGECAPHKREEAGTFGYLNPSEAARLRWSRERARQASSETLDAEKIEHEDEAEVVAALRKKARAGDANAARELRAWLDRKQERPTEVDAAALSRGLRDEILRRLLLEIENDRRIVPAWRRIGGQR